MLSRSASLISVGFKGRGVGPATDTSSLYLLESFSLSLYCCFPIRYVMSVWETLPVASPFRVFNPVMQVAPGRESGITLPTWPEPSFPDWPAGHCLPRAASTLSHPQGRRLPQHRAPGGPTVKWDVGIRLTCQGVRGCLESGGKKNQTDERTPLKKFMCVT